MSAPVTACWKRWFCTAVVDVATTSISSIFRRYSMMMWNMNRSSCASGSGYVPSSSIGFCVAKT